MKIDYTYADAQRIEGWLRNTMTGTMNATKKKGYELGFLRALELCGVRLVDFEIKGRHAVRLYAPDGNEFPQEQIDEYNRIKKGKEAAA